MAAQNPDSPDPPALDSHAQLAQRLPKSIEVDRILVDRPAEMVIRGRIDGIPAAVRILAQPDEAAMAEWTALASIRSDRVAGLLGWGALEPRELERGRPGLWVARRWIDGESLDLFVRAAESKAIAAAVADVFGALEEVHAAGFIHGDLSPGNVIVDVAGRGFLTDFGMASAAVLSQAERGLRRSGTPLFMAPEVLVGGTPTAKSDLFSLAAVLALALAGVEIDPTRFYGRFPAEPFLEAAELDLEQLPQWSRWILTTLLSRDPEKRRAHEFSWAGRLRSEIGLEPRRDKAIQVRPILALEGRERFMDALVTEGQQGLRLVETRGDEETTESLDALAVRLLKRGRGVHRIHAAELASRSRTTLDVDRHLVAELPLQGLVGDGSLSPVLLVSVTGEDAWTLEVLDILGSAAVSYGEWLVLAFVDRLRMGQVLRRESPWRTAERILFPPLGGADLADALAARIKAPQNATGWIDTLDRLAQGSVPRLNHQLTRAAELGAFEWRKDGLAVRPTFRWEELQTAADHRLSPRLGGRQRRVLAAVVVLGGSASVHRLGQVFPGEDLRPAIAELMKLGLVTTGRIGHVQLLGTVPPLAEFELPIECFRTLHGAALSVQGSQHQPNPDSWVHVLGAASGEGGASVDAVVESVRALERQGLRTQIVRGLTRARSVLESENRPLAPGLMAELALALARSGDGAAARSTARLSGVETAAPEVDGILAHFAGQAHESAAAFTRAGRPLQALTELASGALESGDIDEFERMVRQAAELDPSAESAGSRAWLDLLALRASAAGRRGDKEAALALMGDALTLAEVAQEPLAEANLRIGRARLARVMGDSDACLIEIHEARKLFQSVGNAVGEAQAQALLGLVLKDEGRLLAAEQPLSSALGRRERLGMGAAAATTRGTLGILLLERGHLRRSLDELQRAFHALREAGMASAAALVGAALDLALARVGLPAPGPRSTDPSDPRVAKWHGMAERLRCGETYGTLIGSELGEPAAADVALIVAAATHGDPRAHLAELFARAQERAEEGRDASAARLGIAAFFQAAAAGDLTLEREARELASGRLERVLQGLGGDEVRHAESSLLGVLDPVPESLEAWRVGHDQDMDVMKILELNERLVRQEDTATLLASIVEAALEVSGAERGFIVMSHDGTLALDTAFDSSRGDLGDDDVDFSRSIVEEALASRKALRVSDAVEHDEWSGARSVENLQLRSILAAPFFVSPRVAGVVVVDDRSRPGAFGPREERLLELLSGQAALAMRQVHRLEENRRLAAELRRRVVTQGAQLREAERALNRAGVAAPIEGLLGDSHVMDSVRSLIHRVARADIATLITGPSGSGKEVAARAVHALSERHERPFVAENCAALPPSLAESELFGVMKGAFTGADVDRAGLFERADGGTLFLDEIGELPPELQAKLLRVLETRCVRRVGDEAERKVDFRLVSATNRDLAVEAQEGRFRSDLMYRLDGVTISLPSLDERTEDIPILVEHFLSLGAVDGSAPRGMAPAVLRRLMDRSWPGNVRELANEVARLCVLSTGEIVDPELVRQPLARGGSAAPKATDVVGAGPIRTIAELERMAIVDALSATGDDKRKAAELLGISRAKIYQRLKEWEGK